MAEAEEAELRRRVRDQELALNLLRSRIASLETRLERLEAGTATQRAAALGRLHIATPPPVQAPPPDLASQNRETPTAVPLLETPPPPKAPEEVSELVAPRPVTPVVAADPVAPQSAAEADAAAAAAFATPPPVAKQDVVPAAALAPPPIPLPPKSPPVRPGATFLTDAEMNPVLAEAARTEEPKAGIEVRLATKWLTRVGGVFMIVCFAFVAMLIQPKLGPGARVVLSYLVSAIVAAAGVLVLRRSEVAGRTTLAVAFALAYFVSFAAHYLPAMHVMPAILAVLLMCAFAGALVFFAEKWKAEGMGAFGLLLGALAALLSASASQGFALIALAMLAVMAGVLLVRNEWKALTVIALAAVWLAMPLLWLTSDPYWSGSLIQAHFGALMLYHIVFAAAFWKWGRVWVAREQLALDAPAQFGTPDVVVRSFPFSTAFAMLNSVALIGTALLLMWVTHSWDTLGTGILVGLTATQVVHLSVKALRRGGLASFYAITAFSLLCASLVSAFSGLTESVVLAALTLVIVVAATRAHELRWLRPLSAISATLAVITGASWTLAGTTSLIPKLLPGIFLLGSALPWREIGPRRSNIPDSMPLRILSFVAGQYRSLVAAGLIAAVLIDTASWPNDTVAWCSVLAVVLLAGIVLLRAWNWYGAAFLTTLFCVFASIATDMTPMNALFQLVWIGGGAWMMGELHRRASFKASSICMMLAGGAVAFAITFWGFAINVVRQPYMGIVLLVFAAWFLFVLWVGLKLATLPALVREAYPSEAGTSREEYQTGIPLLRVPALAALGLSVAGIVAAVMFDAIGFRAPGNHNVTGDFQVHGLLSAIAWSSAAFVGWFMLRKRADDRARHGGSLAYAFGVALLQVAVLGYFRLTLEAALVASVISVIAIAVAIGRRDPGAMRWSMASLAMLPLVILFTLYSTGASDSTDEIAGLAASLVCLGAFAIDEAIRRHFNDDPERDILPHELRVAFPIWSGVLGSIAVLALLGIGPMLPNILKTASWGAFAIVLLVAGFMKPRLKVLRFIAIGVFAAAALRVFIMDLESLFSRVVAFGVLGVLLIGAGIAYGFLKNRLEGTSHAPPPQPAYDRLAPTVTPPTPSPVLAPPATPPSPAASANAEPAAQHTNPS